MRRRHAAVAALLLVLAACNREPGDCADDSDGCMEHVPEDTLAHAIIPPPHLEMVAALQDTARGRLVYVPAYSRLFRDEKQFVQVTATLSVRNTDPEHPITLTLVHYYNTFGQRARRYIVEPIQLPPMSAVSFVEGEPAQPWNEGDVGASFVVAWRADAPVTDPVIEAVMSADGGLAFASPGRPLTRRPPP